MPEISRLEIKAPLRHDTRLTHAEGELTKNRLQYQVSFHYNFGLVQWDDWGALSLRGLAGTGGSYTSQWSTIYDFKKKETGQQLFNMRQIYFAWNLDRWRLDLGVIAPVKGKVSNTSLDKDGWIRGARFMVPFLESGSLEFVSGILDAIDDPNAFQNWGRWNYAEVEWTHDLTDYARAEAGYVHLAGQDYLRGEFRWLWKLSSDLKIEAATEALSNVTTPTWAFDTSLKVSLPFIALVAEYSYVPSTFGLLGELSNDFFALGHLGMLAMKGPIGDDLGLDWFTKSYVSENELRLVAGIGLSWVYTPEQ